jgi:hypothetical protein
MIQSAEGISGSVREVVSAVQTFAPPTAVPLAQEPVAASEVHNEQQQDVSSEPEPVEIRDALAKRIQRSGKTEGPAPKAASARVVVKSIPDAKRSDRFYTSIRLPRELWDQAGFGVDDKLLLAWSGKALTVERATEGGVKTKAVGDTSVVLQSWKLGNLNLDQPKVAGTNGSLRLTAGRRSPET